MLIGHLLYFVLLVSGHDELVPAHACSLAAVTTRKATERIIYAGFSRSLTILPFPRACPAFILSPAL